MRHCKQKMRVLAGCCGLYLALAGGVRAEEIPPASTEPVLDAQTLEDELAVADKPAKKARKSRKTKAGVVARVDDVWLEAGGFTGGADADQQTLVHGAASIRGPLNENLEFALGARVDGHFQSGGRDTTQRVLDYTENYLRWRSGETRLTVGTQNVLWGRVDELPPADRMSRADLSRFILDELPDRRRAVPAVRYEQFFGETKIDAVWLPAFEAAVMPDPDSVWSPLDRSRGRLLGVKNGDIPAALLIAAQVREDDDGAGGGGVRLTRTGGEVDYGLSLQRSRQSMPYYRLDDLATATFSAVHPYSWVLGGELETQGVGATWRLEGAWSSDVPVTGRDFVYRTEEALDLVAGVELFPGDGETRVTLQLAGHKTFADGPVIDRTRIISFNGEVEHPFAQGRWRFGLRFFAGLDEQDLYLNPKLAYLGIEGHEFYLAGHLFSGASQTLGGFHRDNDLISLGWRAKF